MNAYWRFNKFIKLNKDMIISHRNIYHQQRQKAIRRTFTSIVLVTIAITVPIILQAFHWIMLLNLISIYLLIGNIKRNVQFQKEKQDQLSSHEEAIERWELMPKTHSKLTYDEILDICQKQLSDLYELDSDTDTTEQEETIVSV